MSSFFKAFFILLITFSVFLFWASFGEQNEGTYVETFPIPTSLATHNATDTLRILSWNIAWGHGEGSDGTNYIPSSQQDQFTRLKGISDVIKNVGADIVFLQEVDLEAKRSHFINQMDLISSLTGIPFKSAISTWKAQYIPYPGGLTFSKHWGFTDSGAGVISKFPICKNEYTLYPKSTEKSYFYNLFYPFRYRQKVHIHIGGLPFIFVNNHLEAFVSNTRIEQASFLKSSIINSALTPPIVAFGGDFNSIPSAEISINSDNNFEYRKDSTLAILNSVQGYREVISDDRYTMTPEKFYSYPGKISDKRLDYIFVRNDFEILRSEILDTGDLSDHRPVFVEIVLKLNSLQ